MINKIRSVFLGLKHHEGVNRYLTNTSWLLLEQILRMGVGLFVGVWIARYLGPEEFGSFNYVLAIIAILSVISKLGMSDIVVKELVDDGRGQARYLGTVFWLRVASTIVILMAILFALPFISNNPNIRVYIVIASLGLLFQTADVIELYFLSKVLSKFISLSKIIQIFISTILKIYLIIINADLIWFVVLITFDCIFLSIVMYLFYKFNGSGFFLNVFDKKIAINILKKSWPILLSSLIVILHMKIDQIMIGRILNDRDVGLYSAALRLSEVWYFIPVIISSSLFPAIVNAKKINEDLYLSRVRRLIGFVTWVGIALASLISIFSDQIILTLYGKDYIASGLLLMLHIWTIVFVFNVSIRSSALIIEGRQMYVTVFAFLSLCFHVVLNYLFIFNYGVLGAVFSALITWFLCAVVFPLFLPSTRKFAFLFLNSLLWKNKNYENITK